MEKLRRHEIHVHVLHPLLLLLLSLRCLSSDYSPPTKYFINCGSQTNVDHTDRVFVGDVSSNNNFSLSPKGEVVVNKDFSVNASQIYQAARIFKATSSYKFPIDQSGRYVVRLHFFPFTSQTDLSTALFNVSISGLAVLLRNFFVKNTGNLPVIKEFFVTVNISKFIVQFEPSEKSFAFVSALEVFPVPDNLIPDSGSLITPQGSDNSDYKGISSRVLQKIHRVNAGGSDIEPEGDRLWRSWVADDAFLFNRSTATNKYADGGLKSFNEYIAPSYVYRTAKYMNTNDQLQPFNISWGFNVTKNARHLLRVHFCDIVSISDSTSPRINLYIYSMFSQNIENIPIELPSHFDFVVFSDDSGYLNISVGPNRFSPVNNSFLNGLEIMEIMEEPGLVSMKNESKKKDIFVIVGSFVGGLGLVFIVVVVFLLLSRCRKEEPAEASHWLPVTLAGGLSSRSGVYEATIHNYPVPHLNLGLKIPLAEIQSATKNFSSKLLVGKGGFGLVYQGTLRNGMTVAVKRSYPGHGQGLPEFQTEILVLSRIRHRHLVSLIGYCNERNEMIMVYEFMQNGTLRSHLYDSDLPPLSWKQRMEICIGAARGLHYLHTALEGGIIHRDVKSTNILLDENLVAKVADFGLSKSSLPHQTHVSTAVKGTIGYLDPEYFRTQKLTEKSDVYSFGVVLLEVLCGRGAINPSLPREQVNLAEWVLVSQKEGLLERVIDPSLVGKVNLNSLRKFGETADKCLQEDSEDRPSMGDVVWDLEYAFQLQQTAMQRELLDDSTNDATSTFQLSNVQRYPSSRLAMDDPLVPTTRNEGSETTRSEVFSQLMIDDGR